MLPFVPLASSGLPARKHILAHMRITRGILRKKEAGDITIEERKEFLILDGELTEAHESIDGKRLYPSGEIISCLCLANCYAGRFLSPCESEPSLTLGNAGSHLVAGKRLGKRFAIGKHRTISWKFCWGRAKITISVRLR
jgi:hypothetical protein